MSVTFSFIHLVVNMYLNVAEMHYQKKKNLGSTTCIILGKLLKCLTVILGTYVIYIIWEQGHFTPVFKAEHNLEAMIL